jgi:hypothetical protein
MTQQRRMGLDAGVVGEGPKHPAGMFGPPWEDDEPLIWAASRTASSAVRLVATLMREGRDSSEVVCRQRRPRSPSGTCATGTPRRPRTRWWTPSGEERHPATAVAKQSVAHGNASWRRSLTESPQTDRDVSVAAMVAGV